jgi:ABC-2 type transport system ATP-binding protein
MAIIEAKQLTKQFGELTAVDKIDLSVTDGEIFGLVGPDGAGKTTFIRLIATILLATSGDVTVNGFSVTDQPRSVRPLIGYMSQRFTLYGDLTVLENLRFFADLYKVPGGERDEQVERLLEFSQLSGFTDRSAALLSGGMKQKLALACTLIHHPRILLLDEPTTGVDPVSRREFWKILARLHREGTTILIATPYMDEAERCQRVAFMQNGRIMLCDSPTNIKGHIPGQFVSIETGDVHAAAEVLRREAGCRDVNIYGSALQVGVDDAEAAARPIRDRLEQAGVRVDSIEPIRLSMENVFVHLATGTTESADV